MAKRKTTLPKLTDDEARLVASSSITAMALAAKFGVSATTIANIRHGRAYRHATGIVPTQRALPPNSFIYVEDVGNTVSYGDVDNKQGEKFPARRSYVFDTIFQYGEKLIAKR